MGSDPHGNLTGISPGRHRYPTGSAPSTFDLLRPGWALWENPPTQQNMLTQAPINANASDHGLTADSAPAAHPPITVGVVEDSPILRRNLKRWLDHAPGYKCLCACANGTEALELIPERRPQVVLMDIQMPGMSGIECTARLKRLLPSVQIIMLTVYEDIDLIFKALRAGACGYLLKRSPHPEILEAIREILHGGAPMTSAIARKLVAVFQEPVPAANAASALTAREREILDLLSQGLSNKEIGARLDLSQFTVRNHLAHVFEKLHVRCRTEAVMAYQYPEQKLSARA
jgi:DNA-binding NarL/FixJ family response regulator